MHATALLVARYRMRLLALAQEGCAASIDDDVFVWIVELVHHK